MASEKQLISYFSSFLETVIHGNQELPVLASDIERCLSALTVVTESKLQLVEKGGVLYEVRTRPMQSIRRLEDEIRVLKEEKKYWQEQVIKINDLKYVIVV